MWTPVELFAAGLALGAGLGASFQCLSDMDRERKLKREIKQLQSMKVEQSHVKIIK